MNKQLFAACAMTAALMLGASCGNNPEPTQVPADLGEGAFVIEGQMPAEKFDSACLYLVPMLGPHPRPVDSVFVGKDGKFRFEGNVEQMAVLRLDYHWRVRVQDLLVVTEPGVTHVMLDSISSGYGTPQNDSLQSIKERLEVYGRRTKELIRLRNQHLLDSASYAEASLQLREEQGNWYYRMFKNIGPTTLSRFVFNQMFSGKLDDERRDELKELLKDTTDYSKPQPGFRR